MLNEQLRELYVSNIPELKQMYASLESNKVTNFVGPLLLSCWEDKYLNSKHRLMIFGQETNGWEKECWDDNLIQSTNDVDKYMNLYQNFKLGEQYNTLFWQYAHEINKMINGVDDLNFIWNNVNKFGIDGTGRPHPDVTSNEVLHFNVVAKEIQILKPDVCIFISGHTYDEDLKSKIDDLSIEQFMDFPINEVARYVSKDLPINSFRTYHPGYGNRYQDWYYDVLSKIVKVVNNE